MIFKRIFLYFILFCLFQKKSFSQIADYKRVDTDTAVDQNTLKHADDISRADSIRIKEEFGKSIFPDRHLFGWNSAIQQKDNISAITAIYSDDINSTPVRDITNIMSGRLSGLYTLQPSGQNGADGSVFSLRGRTPLLVIDGVIRQFTDFNPNDIKSITLLKDATATAMYGLRGANGVINIVTKDKSEKSFELNLTAQGGIVKPTITPKFLDAYNYGKLYNEAQLNSNPLAVPKYSDSLLNAYKNGSNDPYLSPNVNWYNTVLKPHTTLNRYSIDMGGTGKSYHYYASLEHYRQSGIFITDPSNSYNTSNSYKRYNVRLNAGVSFNKNIALSVNLFGSIVNGVEPGAGLGGVTITNPSSFSVGSLFQPGVNNLMNLIYNTPPLAYPIRNKDSSYAGTNIWTSNIYASAVDAGYFINNERTMNQDVKLDYNFQDLVPGLWASAALSINNYYFEQINRTKTFAVYQYIPGNTSPYTKYGSDGYVSNGSYSQKNQYTQTYYNFLVGYDKEFGDNKINLLGTYNVDNASYNTLSQLNSIYKTFGLTAKYGWKEKYLAELGMSYSGMNYYPPGKQYGFFPSTSLGWVVNKESFFHADWINLLKIRSSIGLAAWGYPGYFSWLQGYTINVSGDYNIGNTAASVNGAYEKTLANPNITWEKSLQWDAGLELATFNNKLSFVADYYRNRNYDQLITPLNTSSIIGQTLPTLNDGKVNYYGTEINIGYEDHIGKLNYFIKGNVSFAQSKVVNLDEPNYPYSWMYRKGQPVGRIFGYQALGLYQQGDDFTNTPHVVGYTPQAGDIKYKDLNGDAKIDLMDQVVLGTSKPQIFFGVNFGSKIAGFDVSALLQGVQNRNLYVNPSSNTIEEFYNGYGNVQSFHLDRWTPQTANSAIYPRLSIGGNPNNTLTSSFWMKNGDYLRLKNIELGYSLPMSVLNRIHLKGVRFFANAYNLVTWSKVKQFNIDAESGTNMFPNQKVVNGGLSIRL